MTKHEALEILKVSYSTLRRMVERGQIRTSMYNMRGKMGKMNYWDEDVYAMVGRKVKTEHNVVAYFRVNKKNQESRAKMLEQKKLVKLWCAARGITINKEIEDWHTGVDWGEEQRPGFHEILRLLSSGKLEAIVLESRDRLTRFGWPLFENLFKYYGVHVFVVNEAITDPYYQEEQTEDISRLLAQAKVDRIRTNK